MNTNDTIWTPAGTDVTIRWKKMGWVAPSDDPKYKQKWADFKAIMAKTIDDWSPAEKKEAIRGTITMAEFRKRK
jgi:hypothetical protein